MREKRNRTNMAHITIQNIGPIKNVSFDLNKVNVFMGPQSSGKSTIAKIISYCSWFEKDTSIHASSHPDFWNELITFHNLEKSYFSNESRITYKSNFCSFDMKWKNKSSKEEIQYTRKNFRNRKITYIPAERNFVTIPGLGRYNESRDNILSFLYDWFLAKKGFNEDRVFDLPIYSLRDVSFFYDKEIDLDKIQIQNGKIIGLNHASSGLRSCIPLLVVFNHMMNAIYNRLRPQTPLEVMNFYEKLTDIQNSKEEDKKTKRKGTAISSYKRSLAEIYKDFGTKTFQVSEYNDKLNKLYYQKLQAQWADLVGFYGDYFYTLAIIEEPELNLFPKTQQDLVYYMLETLVKSEREHQLVLTTHSPFILFAINNCMMGGLVKQTKAKQKHFPSQQAWIDPKKVSIYEIYEGEITSIQGENGIIKDNYLNRAYKENMDEYLSMLAYYEDEE